jgi:hypothetical protein
MPISAVQQGILTEFLFIILAVLGSDGLLEVARQATDDDRRDADVHRRGDFILNLGFQIKSAIAVSRRGASEWLHIRFNVLESRLVSHPNFYYFFAYLDTVAMRLGDAVFIVPSVVVHKHAGAHLHGDTWRFDLEANLDPKSRDRWAPYRVSPLEVGKWILAIIADLEKRQSIPAVPTSAFDQPGIAWVRRASGIIAPEQRAA